MHTNPACAPGDSSVCLHWIMTSHRKRACDRCCGSSQPRGTRRDWKSHPEVGVKKGEYKTRGREAAKNAVEMIYQERIHTWMVTVTSDVERGKQIEKPDEVE